MGCVVTAFSRSDTKKAEATGFGAKRFVATGDAEQAKRAEGSVDYLLMTAGGPGVDYAQLLNFLDVGGKLILMGFTQRDPIPVDPISLIRGQKTVCGSAAGSLNATRQMLEFAAAHAIRPQCEVIPVAQINDAIQKVLTGTVRYRAVLKFD